ncbi:MAG: OmpH family outer membrane protein [Sphingomonadaceae bacterium]|nr:OmpH family outer membrane protein [Sphingomonadaceae bacterium]
MTRFALAALFAAAAPVAAYAQAPAQGAVLVVDVNRVLTESAAGQSLQAQLKPQLDQAQARQQQLQQQFRTEQENLERAAAAKSVAPETLQQQARDLQQRAATAETELQGRGQALQNAQNQGLQQIINAMNPVVSTLLKERNAQIVLNRSATLQTIAGVDITNDVIARLNQSLPRVAVNVSAAPAASAPAPAAATPAPAPRKK